MRDTDSYVREEPNCGRCGDSGRWLSEFVAGGPVYAGCPDCNPAAAPETGTSVSPEEAF